MRHKAFHVMNLRAVTNCLTKLKRMYYYWRKQGEAAVWLFGKFISGLAVVVSEVLLSLSVYDADEHDYTIPSDDSIVNNI